MAINKSLQDWLGAPYHTVTPFLWMLRRSQSFDWTLWFGRYCRETRPSLLCSFGSLDYFLFFFFINSPLVSQQSFTMTNRSQALFAAAPSVPLILSGHCKPQIDIRKKEETLWCASTDNHLNALVLRLVRTINSLETGRAWHFFWHLLRCLAILCM